MTNLKDIEKNVLSHAHYGEELEPVRDWLILLSIAAALLILAVAWSAWLYLATLQNSSNTTTPPTKVVNTSTIDAAEKVFATRAAQESAYESTYHFVDPSK